MIAKNKNKIIKTKIEKLKKRKKKKKKCCLKGRPFRSVFFFLFLLPIISAAPTPSPSSSSSTDTSLLFIVDNSVGHLKDSVDMSFLGVNTQLPSPPHNVADWLSPTHRRSAHFIAEKTCEMVCYLWFSSSLAPSTRKRLSPSLSRSPPLSNQKTAALQFSASPAFIHFMQKLLETTQVSQSVIVLSLHYIYRLKERNEFSLGRSGSEFRVAVVALMLANKFVDEYVFSSPFFLYTTKLTSTLQQHLHQQNLVGCLRYCALRT